jgi:hypothetical protein
VNQPCSSLRALPPLQLTDASATPVPCVSTTALIVAPRSTRSTMPVFACTPS